jgi:hypothetical protein
MKATFISREKNDVKFTMEFTAEEFESAQIKAYQQNKDKFQVDVSERVKPLEASSKSVMAKAYSLKKQLMTFSEIITAKLLQNWNWKLSTARL